MRLLQSLMASGPMMLVAVVGLLLTIVNWQKLGRGALFAAGGFGLHLFTSLAYLGASAILMAQIGPGRAASSIGTQFAILSVVNGILHAIALACLLAALLAPRTPAE